MSPGFSEAGRAAGTRVIWFFGARKATYTKNQAAAKASIRYFAHRIDRDGNMITRAIFGRDGIVSKNQAYRMIDRAKGRTYFHRIVISPQHSTGESRDLPQITPPALPTRTSLRL